MDIQSAGRERTDRNAWWALAVLFGLAILSYTDRYILNVLIGGIRADLGLSDVAISLAQGPAFAIVYGVLTIVLGRAADRINRRNLIVAGLVVWSIGTVGCGFATSLEGLLVARFIVGIGEAGLFPSAVSLLADAFPPHRRGLAFGVLLTGSAMGAGMAVIAGGALLAWLPPVLQWPLLPGDQPWRGVLLILGGLGAPALLLAALIREPARRAEVLSETGGGSLRSMIDARGGILAAILAALALVAVFDAAATAWTPAYFTRTFAITPVAIAAPLGFVLLIAGAAGNMLGGAAADRLERDGGASRRLRFAALTVLITVPALVYTSVPFAAGLITYGLLVFLVAVVNVTSCSAFLRFVPNSNQGLATAVMSFVLTLTGLASGPTVAALVTDHVFRSPDMVGVSIALIGLIVLVPASLLLWRAAAIAGRKVDA